MGSVALSASAQLLLKGATLMFVEADGHSIASLRPALASMCAGLVCYAASLVFWLFALSRYELSLAYPLLGLSYPLVFLVAVFCPFFAEALALPRVAGVGLILIGVTLVSQSAKTTTRSGQSP